MLPSVSVSDRLWVDRPVLFQVLGHLHLYSGIGLKLHNPKITVIIFVEDRYIVQDLNKAAKMEAKLN